MQFFFMAVGILSILLALLAEWLGIDNNAVWGTGRILLLLFGIFLLGFAVLLHAWKSGRISNKIKHQITGFCQKIQTAISLFFHRLTACQPLSWLISILVIIMISVYAIWYTSRGSFTNFPLVTNTYVDLGDAFLHGQLALLQKPDPRLLALPNPYINSEQRKSIPFIWDSSLYKGKFYEYWGPAPALVFALTEWIFQARPPDQLLVLVSYIGLAIILLALLIHIRKRYYPDVPAISIPIFILTASINIPFLFILGRPQIYETSIIAGQFFLILGFFAWFRYHISTNSHWLVLAGFSWGLAIASRYNLAVSVAVFSIFTIFSIYQSQKMGGDFRSNKNFFSYLHFKDKLKEIALLVIPLASCGIALAIYNYARFDNPLETGQTYQLTLYEPLNLYYSLSYLPSNLFVYLAYPVKASGAFPFFKSLSIQYDLLPGWAARPSGKMFDQVFFGLFSSQPIFWTLALQFPQLVVGLINIRNKKPSTEKVDATQQPSLLIGMLLIACLMQFSYLLVYYYAAMRYIVDFFLPLLLIAYITIWTFDKQIRHMRIIRFSFWILIIGLAIVTIGIGFFAGFDIPPQYLRLANPLLFSSLYSFWNHQYNHIIALIGVPAAFAGTLARITARVIGKFSR